MEPVQQINFLVSYSVDQLIVFLFYLFSDFLLFLSLFTFHNILLVNHVCKLLFVSQERGEIYGYMFLPPSIISRMKPNHIL